MSSESSRATNRSPVSVVIVNHNAGSVLAECVRSVAEQVSEVVVVDNGSDPGSAELILGGLVAEGACKLLISPRNVGFSAGCNLGIEACPKASDILILNPDCLAAPDLVARLWETLQSGSRVGMVGGFLQNLDHTEQRGGRRFIPTPGRALARGLGGGFLARIHPSLFPDFNLNDQPLPSAPVAVEAVSGACMLLRRAALEDAGRMDEGFFLHCEDLDLCLRFRQRGWGVLFDPRARVVHGKGFCGRRKPVFVEWHKHRGMLRFYNKHFRSRYPAILFPFVVLGVWLRFVAMAGIGIFRPGHPSRIRGTRRLFAETPKNEPPVGVIGASSFVGQALIPLLKSRGSGVVAYSRQTRHSEDVSLVWRNFEDGISQGEIGISSWVSLCPLPQLVGLLSKLTARGARRLVALSSTSRFTKIESADPAERRLAESLRESEAAVLKWGANTGVEIVILRPTLVYDGVGDKNIAAIARFINRWGWFPLLAPASGLRQPLHVADAALACVEALRPSVPAGAYDLSGGETLSYREMIARIFAWEGVPLKFVELPPGLVRLLRFLPGICGLSAGVFERMNQNLVFDHGSAADHLGFQPRKFVPPC